MASALLLTHDHQSNNPYALTSSDEMKKAPSKMVSKLHMEVVSDSRAALKRKSMSLNHDGGGNISHGHHQHHHHALVATVDLGTLTKHQKSELRKKLKRSLEEVRTVGVRIDGWVEYRQKFKPLRTTPTAVAEPEVKFHHLHTNSEPNHVMRMDENGLQGRKDVASVVSDPASSSGETPRDMPKEMSQREARLARQPSVALPEASAGTPLGEKMKRTPKANQLYANADFVSGKDKMPPAEKPKPKKTPGKGDARDPKRQRVEAARSKRESDLLKQCTTLLRKLMSHKHGWVFNEPVDADKLGLHDYHTLIQKPMDLGTIKKRLHAKLYPTPAEFGDDVRLTFTNAMTYNPVGHDVYIMAEVLKGIFEDWWKNMSKKLEEEKRRVEKEEEMLANDDDSLEDIADVRRGERDLHSLTRGKSGTRAATLPKPRPDETGKRPMSFEEKRKLSVNLERLPGEKLERIVQIIKKRNPDLGQNEDEIEVDIDSFDNDTLWELDRFVTNYMKSRGKKAKSKAHAQRAEAAQVPESAGVTGKRFRSGGEAGEKDVDIDDDMAPPRFAPVVIDKGRESSSSGSDSSDSGSSDSDSDSGSSSGSESEADDGQTAGAGPRASHEKDSVGSRPMCVSKSSPVVAPEAEKKDESVVSGETPTEKPVSPEKSPQDKDKALRAALLRGRFADLIVKSQEKPLTVNKNDKVDPEKLKRDREELEKRQREEKARLHAEAKAAEIMKRKAEEQAAVLERQKREVEREEARRALQQMEKTVEIDENSAILKDLERLRSGPLDAMLGAAHDAGHQSDGSPDGSSTIALQGGGNALERLGLFIRDDEDDDEPHDDEGEVHPPHNTEEMEIESVEEVVVAADAPTTTQPSSPEKVDVEDGEIDVD